VALDEASGLQIQEAIGGLAMLSTAPTSFELQLTHQISNHLAQQYPSRARNNARGLGAALNMLELVYDRKEIKALGLFLVPYMERFRFI
jgi:hypothetical protein